MTLFYLGACLLSSHALLGFSLWENCYIIQSSLMPVVLIIQGGLEGGNNSNNAVGPAEVSIVPDKLKTVKRRIN